MAIKITRVYLLIGIIFSSLFLFSSCDEDDNLSVNITVNEGPDGDIGGDFTGNGGSGERVISWQNDFRRADYNADITANAPGIFQMIVRDANGSVVLDQRIIGGTEPDSIDGLTDDGEPGTWTVTIILTDFNGDGSYSLSEED